MHLHPFDWAIIILYTTLVFIIGISLSKRAGRDMEQYFVAGRRLPWWIVGTSMVATTFAADTPLAVTSYVRTAGIWNNWFWWNLVMLQMLSVLVFSRLWRRAKVITDIELIELRYSGKPAAILRAFKAIFYAIFYNFIVMGWVLNGMVTIITAILDLPQLPVIIFFAIITLIYCICAGLWGVVLTDLIQFVLAMGGAILLAILAINHIGGWSIFIEKTSNWNNILFIPPFPSSFDLSSISFWNSPFLKFLVFITIMWWATDKADGGGYLIQRMSSAKNEKHALLATAWFTFAHNVLRVWPWIIVALVSMVLFPVLKDYPLGDKAGYPLVMAKVLGPGFLGLLIASFFAAFMSTIDTHLNWGASYLINDIYRRFIKPNAPERHYVKVGYFFSFFLMFFAAIVAFYIKSIERAWEFIWAMGAGIGAVMILRWFWWRINAWSEIAALSSSILMTIIFEIIAFFQNSKHVGTYHLFEHPPKVFGITLEVHHKALIIVPVSLLCWIIITFLTKPTEMNTLKEFYRRVFPSGWWKPVRSQLGIPEKPRFPFLPIRYMVLWCIGVSAIYLSLFGFGYLVFGRFIIAGVMLVLSGLFMLIMFQFLKKERIFSD